MSEGRETTDDVWGMVADGDRFIVDQHGKQWLTLFVQGDRCFVVNEKNEYIWLQRVDLPQ